MILAENPETKKVVDGILDNWGRWCRDDWFRRLGYVPPQTSRYYVAPIKDHTKAPPPINADDAWRCNDAIIKLGLTGYFDDHRILVAWYAHGHSTERMQRAFRCSRATVYRRRDSAMETFWKIYRKTNTCDVRQKVT